jgi:uncharacterized membrane protein (DUF106 family)
MRNVEEFALYAADMIVTMEEDQRRMEQNQRRMEEDQRRMEEAQRRRDELLQRMLQAVAAIQADIVRIDETHS